MSSNPEVKTERITPLKAGRSSRTRTAASYYVRVTEARTGAKPEPLMIRPPALLQVRLGRQVREVDDAEEKKALHETMAREEEMVRLRRRVYAAEVRSRRQGCAAKR